MGAAHSGVKLCRFLAIEWVLADRHKEERIFYYSLRADCVSLTRWGPSKGTFTVAKHAIAYHVRTINKRSREL